MDFYRYFDATKQAEFLYDCVHDTIQNIIPEEINYLIQYDEFKRYLDDEFEMPDHTVALLVKFLELITTNLNSSPKITLHHNFNCDIIYYQSGRH